MAGGSAKKSYFRSTGTPDRAVAESELAKCDLIAKAKKAGTLTLDFYESVTGKELCKITLKAARGEVAKRRPFTLEELHDMHKKPLNTSGRVAIRTASQLRRETRLKRVCYRPV